MPGRSRGCARSAGAIAARRACTSVALEPVTKNVNVGGVTPGNVSRSSETRIDALPGTSQPPPLRWSVWWSENQRAAGEQHEPDGDDGAAPAGDGASEPRERALDAGQLRAAMLRA